MRVSSRGEYGLRALYDLAQHYSDGPVPSSDIARRQSIPPNYLNQLLIVLRRSGLIRSERGRNGGHRLARPPHKITLREAVRVLDGTTAPKECVEDAAVWYCGQRSVHGGGRPSQQGRSDLFSH